MSYGFLEKTVKTHHLLRRTHIKNSRGVALTPRFPSPIVQLQKNMRTAYLRVI